MMDFKNHLKETFENAFNEVILKVPSMNIQEIKSYILREKQKLEDMQTERRRAKKAKAAQKKVIKRLQQLKQNPQAHLQQSTNNNETLQTANTIYNHPCVMFPFQAPNSPVNLVMMQQHMAQYHDPMPIFANHQYPLSNPHIQPQPHLIPQAQPHLIPQAQTHLIPQAQTHPNKQVQHQTNP